jgi:long-chain acyl-CoA synthetase
MENPWFEHYEQGVPKTFDYPDIPTYQLLEETSRSFPHRDAIIFLGKRMTYQELEERVKRFATAISQMGVRKGDRVASILPNCPQFPIAYYGAMRAGAIFVQMNPLNSEEEIQFQLADSGAETVIVPDALDLPAKVKRVRSRTSIKRIINTSIKEYLPFPKNVLYPLVAKPSRFDRGEDIYFMKELLMTHPPSPPAVTVQQDDVALLLYTGGTTGISKGCMLTHRNLVSNAVQCSLWFAKAERGKEIFLSVLPFFHSYGMTTCLNLPVYLGASMIVLTRFERDKLGAFLRCIEKIRPSIFMGVPAMYQAIINFPDVGKYDLTSIKFCISGAAPLPVEVCERFEKLTGGKLVEGYGLTETSPVTHANPLYGKRKIGSIGLPFPNTACRIVNLETGEGPLPAGEIGELCIKGPQVMKGYWNNPEETENCLKDGWLATGDIAKVDEEGYFYIVDRKKDMIITGGFNVYPRDIDEVLFRHPKIKDAVAVGLPDPYRGESVKAFVVLKEGETADEEEILAFCREHLARFKIPTTVEFRDELPKTMIGKVLRKVLREEHMRKQQESGSPPGPESS